MMTFDDIGQHEVDNDKVESSFGYKMKTCFDHYLMQYWLWPKKAKQAQTQGVNKYRLKKKKVTEKLVFQISSEGPLFKLYFNFPTSPLLCAKFYV